MELTVLRKWRKEKYTIGQLLVNGRVFCDTLEDTDRGLTENMSISRIESKKVYAKTAIPIGRYRMDMHTVSQSFKSRSWAKPYGGKIPRFVNVPGFSGCLIHPGNTCEDTKGCLLVGENKAVGKVLNSVAAFKKLMDEYLIPATERGENIWITVK